MDCPVLGSGKFKPTKIRQFSGQIDRSAALSDEPKTQQELPHGENDIPLSLRLAWLVPLNVTAAFILAALVFIGTVWKVAISSASAVVGTILTLEVNYIVLADDLYMFPRRDGIVLGGTHVRGDWSLEPDLAAKSRILSGHARVFSSDACPSIVVAIDCRQVVAQSLVTSRLKSPLTR